YISDRDEVILEDEHGRMRLAGDRLATADLVTGIVIAVCGFERPDGDFEVIDLCLPALDPQPPPRRAGTSSGRCVALVSGLSLDGGDDAAAAAAASVASCLELELLVDFLAGEAGDGEEAKRIERVLLVGNNFAKPAPLSSDSNAKDRAQAIQDQARATAAAASKLDDVLCQLCSAVAVDLMPGPHDPTNAAMPQLAVRSGFLPRARGYSSLNLVPNPHFFELDGVR
ncbi:DNA polymerase delta subunit 2, partial [Cladochytrium tenue]